MTRLIAGVNPYPAMKPAGVEWLGDVPEHWEVRRLVTSIQGCINGIWGSESNGHQDLPCVRVADFDRMRFRVRLAEPTIRAITPKERNRRLLQNGDLLLEKSGGGDSQPVGAVMLYDHDVEAVCSNFVARMPVAVDCDSGFLTYLHSHLYAIRLNVRSIKQTTGIQNIDSSSYLSERVAFPPFGEQVSIARYLDHVDLRINRYIRAKRRLLELLTEQKQAIIHRAVTRGLDPDVRLKPSGVEWLGHMPEHWDVARLAETAALVNGFPFDSELFDPSNGIPLVRIRDLFKEKTAVRWTGGSIPEASIADRDVLIGMDGDFNVAWWDRGPALLNQRLCCVRALPSRASQRYLFYCLRFPLTALNEVTYATTVKHLSSLDVLKFRLPLPPLPEQTAIIRYLDRETARIDTAIGTARREIALFNEYQTRLIADVVTGKLDVREAAAALPEIHSTDLEDIIKIDEVATDALAPELAEFAT